MEERELAQYYEQRRGQVSLWGDQPAAAKVRRGSTVVFSIRLSRDELQLLQARAQAEGITVSEFIRRCALEAATSGTASRSAMRIVEPAVMPRTFFTISLSEYVPTVVIAEPKKSGRLQERSPTAAAAQLTPRES